MNPAACSSPGVYRQPAPPARLEAENVALLSNVRTGPDRTARLRFAIEQRIFGAGFGRAAAARAWYRRYDWIQTRRRLGTLGAFRALLKTPLRILRESWRATASHGPAVCRAHGVSLWAQRLQLTWLALRRGLDAESYYRFWLFRPERRRKAHLFIQQHEAGLIYRVLAVREALDDFYITDDKRRFDRWCREHALPTVTCVAEFVDGSVQPPDAFISLPLADLFSKPAGSYGGEGARRWSYAGWSMWRAEAGTPLDRNGLLATLAAQSRGGAVLLQECLENHEALAHLTSGALCTVRIVTIRPAEGAPELVCAVFRMATAGHSTDNFSIAGLAAPVDLSSGSLGSAVRSDPELVIAPVANHPDTGRAIAGTLLPWWAEARALALHAHSRLRAMACVGWDIALTRSGPVLIEANWAPGARLAQAPSGQPLGETGFMRYLDEHMKRSFARRSS